MAQLSRTLNFNNDTSSESEDEGPLTKKNRKICDWEHIAESNNLDETKQFILAKVKWVYQNQYQTKPWFDYPWLPRIVEC